MKSRLPSELWSLVLSHLWRRDLRACLFVSRTLHALALARLFRAIQLHFVVRASVPGDVHRHERETAQTARTGEILNAIISDKGGPFANAVRKIVVLAARAPHEYVIERRILIEALAALPHLLEFTWVGRFPPLRQDVVNGLASSCRNLMHLSVEEPLLVRFGFTRLTSISWEIGDMGNAYSGPFEALVAANLESLRSLATDSQILDHLPVRSVEGLHHLEIRQKEGYRMEASTQLALRHCPQLESLVLRDFFNTEIADIVASACGRMPSLRSFAALRSPKLNPYEGVLLDYARKLISFLAPIPNLRRLHLHIPATYELPGAASSVLTDLLRDIGKHCPRLEALGLGLSAMDDILLFEALAASLPLSLRAVSLSLRGNPLESTSSTPLLERLAELPHLAFLYIGWGTHWQHALNPSPEKPVRDMHALQVIILDNGTPSAWDISRAVGDPSGMATLERWPRSKLEHRCAEDFPPGTEDGEWLVRHTIGRSF